MYLYYKQINYFSPQNIFFNYGLNSSSSLPVGAVHEKTYLFF